MAFPAPTSAQPVPIDPFAGLHWDNTLGALLIGVLASGMLFGLTCMQAYTYFERASENDGKKLKTFVACLWLLDALDFAFNCHTIYFFLVTNYTNPLALSGKIPWSLALHVLITSVVDFLVRAMFARKIYSLSRRSLRIALTGILFAGSSLDLVIGIVITAKAFSLPSLLDLKPLQTLFYVNFAAGTGSDVYIAVVLSYFLARARTGFNTRTNNIVGVLIKWTIQTGLLTAIDAAAGLIMAIVMPRNFIFVAPYLILSKLYTNAYLAVLNSRESLRERASSDDGFVSVRLSRIGSPPVQSSDTEQSSKGPFGEALRVHIDQSTISRSTRTRDAEETISPISYAEK
ncbi:hypothetical protein PENSPDRAFT_686909 [Peniophora sp. CONT]|nr:hypothetical protein PENSPDRAFT_686909 [Peniophora sp. CONT]